MTLRKIKRPGGVHSFELEQVTDDHHGVWLYGAPGARWITPDDAGELPFPVLVLISVGKPYVTWWVADPNDRRIEVDVCLVPEPSAASWSYVDLELDPVRHEESGRVEIEDVDELDQAHRAGSIDDDTSEFARSAALLVEKRLRQRVEPWGEEGWTRLASVTRREV